MNLVVMLFDKNKITSLLLDSLLSLRNNHLEIGSALALRIYYK